MRMKHTEGSIKAPSCPKCERGIYFDPYADLENKDIFERRAWKCPTCKGVFTERELM